MAVSTFSQFCALLLIRWAAGTNITTCTTGAANISSKAFHVQVCNLFGGTCYINHPSIQDCATESLEIASGECKLYPIFEYVDNWVRSGASAVEELSTEADLDCSVYVLNGEYRFSGACAAVQCALGDGFVGPGLTSATSASRDTGVTNTATASWQSISLVSIPDEAAQLKNVFLYRTGDYVATLSRTYTWNNAEVTVAKLPTSNGNNYGPVACPTRDNLIDSTIATALSGSDMKMCGSTAQWVYYNAVNLLMDASHYATFSGDTGSTSNRNIAAVPFLDGRSSYRSGTNMADPRAVMLHSDNTAASTVLMTSETIEPLANGAGTGETAGAWRNYGVVFYCDDYARTDLTVCAEANRKMLYVADPWPEEQYGAYAANIGGGTVPDDNDGGVAGAPRATAALGAVLSLLLSYLM